MKNFLQKIRTLSYFIISKEFKQFCLQSMKNCFLFCSQNKILLLNLLRAVLILCLGLVSIFSKDLKTTIYLIITSVFFFFSLEIILFLIKKKFTSTFYFLSLLIVIAAQVSGAAYQYVTAHYFIPLYNFKNIDDICVYSGINTDKKSEEALEYVLNKVREVRSSLRNEFRTDPPSITLIFSRNTAEFAHIIKANSPYAYEESYDAYENIPMITRQNTIIVNLNKGISESGISEEMFKYQLFYELSHIYYNNYSLNRDKFLKEGLARYFSKKYAGYDKLDQNYDVFLTRWKKTLEKEYLNTDRNNIPLILGNYTEEKAYEDPNTWDESGNLAYNLINWTVENYSNNILLEIVSDLGKGKNSDETFIRLTGFDLKGAVWHSIMDDWYQKQKIRRALALNITNLFGDISRYTIYIGAENNRVQVPGEFYNDELVNWLNINIHIQPEITVTDITGKKILQTQKGNIIFPIVDSGKNLF